MEQFYEVEAKVSNDKGRPYIMPARSVISLRLKLELTKRGRRKYNN